MEKTVDILPHQLKFATDRSRFCALVGGFGSGKSHGAVYRALDRLQWRDHGVYLLVAPTYSLLADVNIPDFEQVFGDLGIRYDFQRQHKRMIVHTPGIEGEVWFRSGDRPERMIGFDVTDANLDEFDTIKPEKQRDLWVKVLSRLRGADNPTLGVTTTPEGFRETYQLFQKRQIGPLIRARTTDNHFLPQDYVDALYSQYDEQLVKQYIEAQFVNLNQLAAYYAFDRARNGRATDGAAVKDAPEIHVGLDFNVDKMCAELFLLDRSRKAIHFFDEIILKNSADTQRMADILAERYPRRRINVYPDATGKQRRTSATESDIAILRRSGFHVYARPSNPFVRDRLAAANVMLDQGRLTVDVDACPDLVEDFEQVARDQYGEIDKSDPQRTHSSDAATYPVAYLFPVRERTIGTVRRAV